MARRTEVVLDAFFAGAVDLATNDLHTGVLGADIVILATPVWTIVDMLDGDRALLVAGHAGHGHGQHQGGDLCGHGSACPLGVQPVGGHPMTGKETSGFTAPRRDSIADAIWVLSPLARTEPGALALAVELADACGRRPIVLDADRHDRLVASISHLPYLVASALVDAVAAVGAEDPLVWDAGRRRLSGHEPRRRQRHADVSGYPLDQSRRRSRTARPLHQPSSAPFARSWPTKTKPRCGRSWMRSQRSRACVGRTRSGRDQLFTVNH